MVLNLNAGYRLSSAGKSTASINLRVMNALDTRYETGGYFDYDNQGNYVPLKIPAATRNALAELRVDF
jgi:hypothetical protein